MLCKQLIHGSDWVASMPRCGDTDGDESWDPPVTILKQRPCHVAKRSLGTGGKPQG